MKKVLFLLVLVLGFISCSSDSPTPVKKDVFIKVHASYTTDNPNAPIPDAQSKVYVYYDYIALDFIGYSLKANGLLVSGDGTTISPDQSAQADANGDATIVPTYRDKPAVIIIESNHYEQHVKYSYTLIEYIDPLIAHVFSNEH